MNEIGVMLRIAARQRGWMLAGILLGVAVIAANSLLMALSGWFIASMAVAGASGASFNYFFASGGIRFLAIARTVGRYIERLVTHEAAFRVLADLRCWLFDRLEPLAPAVLERYTGGDVSGRLRADVDALETAYLRIVVPCAAGSVSIVAAVLFVAAWHIPSSLILLTALLAVGAVLPLVVRRLSEEPGRHAAAVSGELRSGVTEGLQGAEELVLLGAADRHAAEMETLSARLVREQERLGIVGGITMAGTVTISGLGLAAMLLAASAAVNASLLRGPNLVMLLLFAAAAFEAASALPTAFSLIPSAREAIRRLRQLADSPLPVPDPPAPSALPDEASIRFNNVFCSHLPGRQALEGFMLDIPAGECVVLTGPSGCGKSTVAEILLRFRSYGGSVTVGGTEISSLAADDLRQQIAYLPQNPHLFSTSIRENILLGRGVAEERLQQVLADTMLTEWVASLPEGLDTPVGEAGRSVSGGEARRIALARALLLDPPVLILDEPTEGLDRATETRIVERLQERLKGRTALVVSHRLACYVLGNRVVRMEAAGKS